VHVLHVDTALEWRGGQQQLAYLLDGRPGDGWAGVPGSPLAERHGPPAVALLPGNDPRNAWRLRRAFDADAPWGALAAHTPHALGLALFSGRPVVAHRRVDFRPRGVWKYRRARGVVAVSEGVRRVLEGAGLPGEHVAVVHDGVRVPPAAELPAGLAWLQSLPRPLYVAVGALVAHKGHATLVDAFAELDGSLVIAGEGELRPLLEARIAERRLSGRVFLVGRVEPVGGLIRAGDAFVHPSIEEGLGQVVIEALGAGARVVATAAGGIPEVVGAAGVLVPPGDPAALADGLRRVLGLPWGLGVEHAAQWSVDRMVEGTTRAYDRFLHA
jgi:glycosyltransferase involved in cell wall biosynthesis